LTVFACWNLHILCRVLHVHKSSVCVPRPPCRYLEENVGALGVQLTAEDLQELEAACPYDKVGLVAQPAMQSAVTLHDMAWHM
jgi:hypothetical protein